MFENLKALRKQKKMTQAEFANSVGLKPTTYSGYEKGDREPDAAIWIRIADTYDVSIDYLLGHCDSPHGTGCSSGIQLKAEEETLVTAWRQADQRAKDDVAHALRNFGFELEEPKEKTETA